MKKTGIKTMLFAAVAVGFTALSASAAVTLNVIANSAGAGFYRTSTGAALPEGSLMRVGTLDLAAFNLLSSIDQSSFASVNSLFTEVATLTASATGTFFQTGINITGEAATGSQLYAWVFNAGTGEAATEYGLFSSSNALWKVPADPGSATLSNVGYSGVQGQLLYGTGFTATGTGSGTNAFLASAPVPEPSAVLLSALGALGLLRRRRA